MYFKRFSGDLFLTVLVFKKLYTFILDYTLDLTNYSNYLVLRYFTYYTSKDSDHTVIYDLVIYAVIQKRILYIYIIQDYT